MTATPLYQSGLVLLPNPVGTERVFADNGSAQGVGVTLAAIAALYGNGLTTSTGTFTANAATPVAVADIAVTTNSVISVTVKTVGGTPAPSVVQVTPGTGFTFTGTAGDTSIYNYRRFG